VTVKDSGPSRKVSALVGTTMVWLTTPLKKVSTPAVVV